jgi:hypothetical protein
MKGCPRCGSKQFVKHQFKKSIEMTPCYIDEHQELINDFEGIREKIVEMGPIDFYCQDCGASIDYWDKIKSTGNDEWDFINFMTEDENDPNT